MNEVTLFKALNDETRLRLVNICLHFELNVNEIVTITGMGQSRISRHLKILTDSGILSSRRDGLWTFYSVAAEGEGKTFVEAVKYLFPGKHRYQTDLEEARKAIEERSRETTRFFDSIAKDWEKLKREIFGNLDLNGLILETIPGNPGTVVDLGCGTGDLLPALESRAEQVIGVEKSPKMLEEARWRFADDDNAIDLRIGALEHLPLREEEADLAVTNMVLHHLPDPQTAMSEVNRVLKQGGHFIIVDLVRHEQEKMRERFGDHWLGFSKEELLDWLDHSGFSCNHFKEFDLKKGLKGFIVRAQKK